MNKRIVVTLPLLLAATAFHVQAQSISPAWDVYRHPQPAQDQQPAQQPAPAAAQSPATVAGQPEPLPSQPAAQPVSTAAPQAARYRAREKPRGGFFVGAQWGSGWVYEDVDQNAWMLDAGYRWQVGAVSKLGVEVAGGRLDATSKDGWDYPEVRFASIGGTGRFNFGPRSRWYVTTRLGYWSANDSGDEGVDVDGAYVGVGLGVDLNRHFNLNLQYTAYLYANSYYYSGYYSDYYGTEVNRADVVTLGAELRF